MSKITVIASFYPKEDKHNDVREILFSMINPTRLEEGNELYNLYEENNAKGQAEYFKARGKTEDLTNYSLRILKQYGGFN